VENDRPQEKISLEVTHSEYVNNRLNIKLNLKDIFDIFSKAQENEFFVLFLNIKYKIYYLIVGLANQ